MQPDYGLIFSYGIQMTITFLIGLGLYTIKILASQIETAIWYRANALRLAVCLGLFWIISSGLVLVPNIAGILGAFGFNADQSAAGIALVIVGLVVGGTGTNPPKVEVEISQKTEQENI